MDQERKQLLEQIVKIVSSLHRHIDTNRNNYLSQFELSRPQMEVLFSINYQSPTMGQLSKHFGVSLSATSQMVDVLTEKGLVERVHNEKDRRVTYIRLSKQGAEAFQRVRAHFIEHLAERFEGVSSQDLENLVAATSKVAEQLFSAKKTPDTPTKT